MLVIGLTGPSGAGKSAVSEILKSTYGLPVINADDVWHRLILPPTPCLDELAARFGTEILDADGTLSRQRLSQIVFSDPAALEDLNAISHRYIMEDIRAELEALRDRSTRAAVLDAPQLFEAGADKLCTVVVSVLANPALRLERIMKRDGIDVERAMRRMRAQKSDEYFRTHSDYVIENDMTVEQLYPAIRQILLKTGVIAP